MIIAHLSDFHICRHGTRLTQLQDVARRTASPKGWQTIRTEGTWSIQARDGNGSRLVFRERLRLIDGAGAVHRVIRGGRGAHARGAAIDDLLSHMESRDRTMPQALAASLPTPRDLRKLLARDPDNLNLRFCAVVHALRRAKPDHIVITGDITDDAEGFELFVAGFEPFLEAGKVSLVPGNHDLYASPPLWVAKAHRKTDAEKRQRWGKFMSGLGMPGSGSHVREIGLGVMIAGLDSCHRAKVPGSASGMVPLRDLQAVSTQLDARGGQLRIACLHHHVLNPPIQGVGRAPMQAGMRLRNAKKVFARFKDLRFNLVMNGHRHVGYRYQPAMAPLFLSAPSSTIGCRTGESPFFWRIDADAEGIHRIDEVPIPLRGG